MRAQLIWLAFSGTCRMARVVIGALSVQPDAGRNRPDRKAVREHYRRTADDIKCTVTVIHTHNSALAGAACSMSAMPLIATKFCGAAKCRDVPEGDMARG
jgi:hypothetical protein